MESNNELVRKQLLRIFLKYIETLASFSFVEYLMVIFLLHLDVSYADVPSDI